MSEAVKRTARAVPEREIAIALVLEFAENEWTQFSMLGAYDDDAEFIGAVAERVGCACDKPFTNKMRRVVTHLWNYRVLEGRMMSTQKYYVGEPTHQKNYWLRSGKPALIRREAVPGVCMGPMGETEFLLRHAYPRPEVTTPKDRHEQ